MNLPTRIYRHLKENCPNEWQDEEAIIALAKKRGYGREETISTLKNMAKMTPAHAQIIERIRRRKTKIVEYRWTEESDWEKLRLEQIAFFDNYPQPEKKLIP